MIHKFQFRCIAYQEKDGTYTGVCLDLNLVEEGHPSLKSAIASINEAVICHMETAKKFDFPKELLYRPAPKKYWRMLISLTEEKEPKNLPNFQFFDLHSTSRHLSARQAAYA